MAAKNGLPPIHPGDFLKERLDELGLSQNVFAQAIGVSPMRISHVIRGSRPVTAELAVLFGKAFGQTPNYWMNLQTSYDLKTAQKAMEQRVQQVQPLFDGCIKAIRRTIQTTLKSLISLEEQP